MIGIITTTIITTITSSSCITKHKRLSLCLAPGSRLARFF